MQNFWVYDRGGPWKFFGTSRGATKILNNWWGGCENFNQLTGGSWNFFWCVGGATEIFSKIWKFPPAPPGDTLWPLPKFIVGSFFICVLFAKSSDKWIQKKKKKFTRRDQMQIWNLKNVLIVPKYSLFSLTKYQNIFRTQWNMVNYKSTDPMIHSAPVPGIELWVVPLKTLPFTGISS